jgi:hypothetical protein
MGPADRLGSYDQIANANVTRQKSPSIVTAITTRSALKVSISLMGGDNLIPKHLCPGCGRPMGLTRTTPARAPSDERDDSFIPRVKLC